MTRGPTQSEYSFNLGSNRTLTPNLLIVCRQPVQNPSIQKMIWRCSTASSSGLITPGLASTSPLYVGSWQSWSPQERRDSGPAPGKTGETSISPVSPPPQRIANVSNKKTAAAISVMLSRNGPRTITTLGEARFRHVGRGPSARSRCSISHRKLD
jgi:hypothetical protein